ncbi:MAG: hypothetical protein ACKO4W_09360, partial [Bacteroidota bacterium]
MAKQQTSAQTAKKQAPAPARATQPKDSIFNMWLLLRRLQGLLLMIAMQTLRSRAGRPKAAGCRTKVGF